MVEGVEMHKIRAGYVVVKSGSSKGSSFREEGQREWNRWEFVRRFG